MNSGGNACCIGIWYFLLEFNYTSFCKAIFSCWKKYGVYTMSLQRKFLEYAVVYTPKKKLPL